MLPPEVLAALRQWLESKFSCIEYKEFNLILKDVRLEPQETPWFTVVNKIGYKHFDGSRITVPIYLYYALVPKDTEVNENE